MILIIMGLLMTAYRLVSLIKSEEKNEYCLLEVIDAFVIPIFFILEGIFLYFFDIVILVLLCILIIVEKIIVFFYKRKR